MPNLDSPATIEFEPDPRTPGRVGYRVTGPTWHAVQNAIIDLMEARGVVHAQFTTPARVPFTGFGQPRDAGRFAALGFTMSAMPVAAE